MRRIPSLFLAAFLAPTMGLWLSADAVLADQTFYVAPDGNDANPGTGAQPFATIQRAQVAVRSLTESGLRENVAVVLREGTYVLEESLRFGPLDAGTSEHSVTYRAAENEAVTLSAGREIHGWQKGADGLWVVDLPAVKEGDWFFRQLFIDGKRMPRGRYPKEGFLEIATVSEDYRTLAFTEPLPAGDFGGQDTEVVVVQNWSISRERVMRTERNSLEAETPIGWVGHSHCLPKPGMSVFLENALSLVSEPGQWYLDRTSGRLYIKAAPGETPASRRIVAPVIDRILDIKGTPERPVRNLRFVGLGFAHTNWLIPEIGYGGIQACYYGTHVDEPACFAVGAAIEMDYGQGCLIQRCRITGTGGSGIGLGPGCRDNRVVGCEISDIGATGVNVGHMRVKDPLWADWADPRDVPHNNEIANCYIHHCGADLWGGHGIFDAMTRDTKIRHNEVAWIPYGGIATGYVWSTDRTSQQGCVIEYNHVYEVTLKLNDSGCLYTLGFQPGSIIRGNLLHGVRFGGFAGGQICNNGIFFDEGSKGFLLEDNVIYEIDQAPGARNTAVRYNHSSQDWHIWIHNTIQTDAQAPEAAGILAETAGLEPAFRNLRTANH